MSESSSTENSVQTGTELASSLTARRAPRKKAATTAKKSPAKKTTAKKSTVKKTTVKKATAKKSTVKKAPAKKTAAKKTTAASATQRKRSTTTSANRASASLKTDLKNLTEESYATGDFTRGAIVLIEQEGVDILRDALMVMIASKTPFVGSMVSGVALESMLDKLTDNYKKLTVADRKALRAVINWLRGDANADDETKESLVAMLNGQELPPTTPVTPPMSTISTSPTERKLKPLRKQG